MTTLGELAMSLMLLVQSVAALWCWWQWQRTVYRFRLFLTGRLSHAVLYDYFPTPEEREIADAGAQAIRRARRGG